jgi:hypothetical protein
MKPVAAAALVALCAVTACNKKNTTADTSTMRGMDTVGNTTVPVTDTVVKTTTTDTIQGQAKTDSMKNPSTRTKTKTKTGTKTKGY